MSLPLASHVEQDLVVLLSPMLHGQEGGRIRPRCVAPRVPWGRDAVSLTRMRGF